MIFEQNISKNAGVNKTDIQCEKKWKHLSHIMLKYHIKHYSD